MNKNELDEDVHEKVKIPRFTGGPHNVGDPDDKSLRFVERENSVTQILQNRTRVEKCFGPLKLFRDCTKNHQEWFGLKFLIDCRPERDVLNDCLVRWYWDPEWVNENTKFYLDKRTYVRNNGSAEGWVYDADRDKKAK